MLTAFMNHKKLLSPFNLPPSVCVKSKISSKLKDLPFLVQNCGPKDDRCQYWRLQESRKNLSPLNSGPSICAEFQISSKMKLLQPLLRTIITIEFSTLCNYDLKDDRCQYWQVPNLTGLENYKKLLSLLNSPPSLCAEYEISSKLKHFPFFVQNYGLTDDKCQHWQVSTLTGVINYKKLLPPLNSPPSICEEYFIKIEAFVVLRTKLWPERWQVLTLAGVKNHRKLLSSMNSVPSNCSVCKVSWKMVNLILRSPFPIPRSRFPFLKIAALQLN